MRRPLSDFSTEPLFNIKAVEQQTGIAAATLRAWERRYRLVTPQRTSSGYRLYTERDVALLRWIQQQMLDGLTISRAVAMLQAMRDNGETIWIETAPAPPSIAHATPLPPADLVAQLYSALVSLDSARADQLMAQAFAMYSLSEICTEVIIPTLHAVGDGWASNGTLITYEHFASNYLSGRLITLLQTFGSNEDTPHLLVGCAPGEFHEIGALIFAVLARQHGYHISYLGQDVPVEDVAEAVAQERPAMVILAATRRESALALAEADQLITAASGGKTRFAYGGHAFDEDGALREQVRGTYLGADLVGAVTSLYDLVPLTR